MFIKIIKYKILILSIQISLRYTLTHKSFLPSLLLFVVAVVVYGFGLPFPQINKLSNIFHLPRAFSHHREKGGVVAYCANKFSLFEVAASSDQQCVDLSADKIAVGASLRRNTVQSRCVS